MQTMTVTEYLEARSKVFLMRQYWAMLLSV